MPPSLALLTARLAPAALRDEAWALKQACHAAWSCQPQQAVQAAQALRRLSEQVDHVDPALQAEVVALADWTEGIACLTQGRLEDACGALDRAEAGFARIGQALHAAETRVPKIMGLTLLGRHDDAASCGEAAEREFIAQGHTLAAAKVSLNLGSLQLRRDAHAEAARHYRAAAVRFARVGDHEHSVMADIGLADALTALGQIDEAQRMLARARMRASTHRLPVLEAMADESAALLALACGRYRDALAGFEGSRRAYEQLQMPQHLAVAEKQLADAYLELRLLPEALALFERAVARFRRTGHADRAGLDAGPAGPRTGAVGAQPAGAGRVASGRAAVCRTAGAQWPGHGDTGAGRTGPGHGAARCRHGTGAG